MTLTQSESGSALSFSRFYTNPGEHPFDQIEWEWREARIPDHKSGTDAFYAPKVEFPVSWSQNATNIVAQKYFRVIDGVRETSLRQTISRIAGTIANWGSNSGYFDTTDAAYDFECELSYLMVNQMAAFNSPVWFNIGVPGAIQTSSACFLLNVEDSMSSILNWITEEGLIFKGGSGSGVNLSKLRSTKERLSGGGTSSGPVSFMRGADASAGAIKSGGSSRRSAKMVRLDIDHPDIEEFITCKVDAERKARVLRSAGYDMDLDGVDSNSLPFQNANNSVGITDEFMQAYLENADWSLKAVTTGEIIETVKARHLMRIIAEAAWECADPGVQFDTTINKWHTSPAWGRIETSNPCFVQGTLVDTSDGYIDIALLAKMSDNQDDLPMAACYDAANSSPAFRQIKKAWVSKKVVSLIEVATKTGHVFQCTPEHPFLTDKGYVEAGNLRSGDSLIAINATHSSRITTDWVKKVSLLELDAPTEVFDLEVDELHNFAVSTQSHLGSASVVVHNCSEYFSNTNTSCNLASFRLTKFLKDDDEFDTESFSKAVRTVFIAQDILIERGEFPTEAITRGTKAHRQIGIGYTDLGALLMELGLPYDSDDGRSLAGSITSLLTSTSYLTSTELAESLGAYPAYTDGDNKDSTLAVLQMHRDVTTGLLHSLDGTHTPFVQQMAQRAAEQWSLVYDRAFLHGVRNSQASVIAPAGTISFALDADTTSAEPDFSLVKNKKLVGGGTMKIVNQAIPRALKRMGYDEESTKKIVDYIFEHGSALGAPGLHPEHLPVFACAVGEPAIAPMGHLKMMAAIQPFISGAISKTCNLPEDSTVEDIERLYVEAWKMGLKSLAVYRDNCKVGQPLSTNSKVVVPPVIEPKPAGRERLPKKRTSYTQSFKLGDSKGYLHVGEYPDGSPGEIFLRMSKQGSTLLGVIDGLATAMSLGLQHGVPLESFVDKFINTRFAPQGFTDDVELRSATSILDFIARRLAVEYMTYEERSQLGILTVQENATHTAPKAEQTDEPEYAPTAAQEVLAKTTLRTRTEDLCGQCGGHMIKAGTCHVCETCGTTTGCS